MAIEHRSRPSRWSSSAAGVRTSRGGDDKSDSKTLPETIRNDAHPRTFRTLVDFDYRDTRRLDCRDAPPLECSVHGIRSHEVSIHMHCTQLVMSLNTIYQLVFWSVQDE